MVTYITTENMQAVLMVTNDLRQTGINIRILPLATLLCLPFLYSPNLLPYPIPHCPTMHFPAYPPYHTLAYMYSATPFPFLSFPNLSSPT